MALRSNANAGNVVLLIGSGCTWGGLTFTCFFKLSTDQNDYGTLFTLGSTAAYENHHLIFGTEEDGTTFGYYEDSLTDSLSILNLTVGRTYGIAVRNSGTGIVIHVVDTVTGTVTTATRTLPSGYVGNAMEGFRLGDDFYSEPWPGTVFGVKLFNAALTEEQALNELRTILPARPASLVGWWPMLGNTKSLCLIDYSGNGRSLTEAGGTGFTVEDSGPIPWGAKAHVKAKAPQTGTIEEGAAASSGSAAAVAVGAALFSGAGASSGSAAAAAVGAALFSGAGAASGTGAASAIGRATTGAAGAASAAATAGATGRSTAAAAGAASAAATAGATGRSTAAAAGAAAAAADAEAIGSYSSSAGSEGAAAGSAAVAGVGASIAAATGVAAGSSDASAVGVDASAPLPAPAPPPPAAEGAPTGHRVAVRIDGQLYVGSYREISDLIEARARQDAERSPQPSKSKARKSARKLVGDLRALLEIEEPLLLPGIAPDVIANSMFRDLRALYSDVLVNAMLESNRVREQQDEEAAMKAAEMLLLG